MDRLAAHRAVPRSGLERGREGELNPHCHKDSKIFEETKSDNDVKYLLDITVKHLA